MWKEHVTNKELTASIETIAAEQGWDINAASKHEIAQMEAMAMQIAEAESDEPLL